MGLTKISFQVFLTHTVSVKFVASWSRKKNWVKKKRHNRNWNPKESSRRQKTWNSTSKKLSDSPSIPGPTAAAATNLSILWSATSSQSRSVSLSWKTSATVRSFSTGKLILQVSFGVNRNFVGVLVVFFNWYYVLSRWWCPSRGYMGVKNRVGSKALYCSEAHPTENQAYWGTHRRENWKMQSELLLQVWNLLNPLKKVQCWI